MYATLSPYLNGIKRTSNAAQLAQADAAAQRTNPARAQTQIAAEGATAAPPFANPAITEIGQRSAVGQSLVGDSGTVIQSDAAVLFAASSVALAASAVAQPIVPLVPPVAIVVAEPRVAPVT